MEKCWQCCINYKRGKVHNPNAQWSLSINVTTEIEKWEKAGEEEHENFNAEMFWYFPVEFLE